MFNVRFLRDLQMNECRQISDAAVGALAEGCQYVNEIACTIRGGIVSVFLGDNHV